jgi:hypothetical protein
MSAYNPRQVRLNPQVSFYNTQIANFIHIPPQPNLKMNYANMIEERKLKQGFIIATLISTIVGTFTTGIGLFDRLNDKRKQHKRDHSQDDKISELERRVGEAERRTGGNGRDGRGDGNGRGSRDGRDGDDGGLRDSLEYGGGMVRREYDAGFERMGRRFGEGDCMSFLPSIMHTLTHQN